MKLYLHFEEQEELDKPLTIVAVFHKTDTTVQQLFKVVKNELIKRGYRKAVKDKAQFFLLRREHGNEKMCEPSDVLCDYFTDNEELIAKFVNVKKYLFEEKMERKKEILDYRGDMETYDMPDGTTKFNPKTVDDWMALAEKWRILGNPQKTVQIFGVIVNSMKARPEIFEELVKIYLEANRPRTALDYLKLGQQKFPNYRPFKMRLIECYMANGEADRVIDMLMDYVKELREDGTATPEQRHQVQIALCRAYQMKGEKDMALVVITGLVKELQQIKGENDDVVIEYARLTYDLSPANASEASKLVLSSFISDKDNKFRQKAYAELCQKPKGLEYLDGHLKHAAIDPISLTFFANMIKCHGAVKEAKLMYEKAVLYDPKCPQYILNYVHILELYCKYEKAYKVLIKFFEDYPNKGLARLKNKDVYSCIKHVKSKNIYLSGDSLEGRPCETEKTEPEVTEECEKNPYKDDELLYLALWFTLIKILYISGATGLMAPLIKLLDPFYKKKKLHTTFIRNETAYYASIRQLVALWQCEPSMKPVMPSGDKECIYLLGDSHCLSPGWQTISYRNKCHVIHPLLSTGTKIWHIRPESVFYPKVNFEHAVKKIPDNATVIMVFGEIDCREGLVVAVEKCKYDTIMESIQAIVEIYVKIVLNLQKKHNWRIYVHPVPPVLHVTRKIVIEFNKQLGERLEKESSVHWLPLEKELLDNTNEKATLKSKYDFDESHLHPRYVKTLQSIINNIHLSEDDPWSID